MLTKLKSPSYRCRCSEYEVTSVHAVLISCYKVKRKKYFRSSFELKVLTSEGSYKVVVMPRFHSDYFMFVFEQI